MTITTHSKIFKLCNAFNFKSCEYKFCHIESHLNALVELI